MSELRYNKLTRDWILFSPNRARRPSNFPNEKRLTTNIENCPFEVGNEDLTPNELARVSNEKSWQCRVVPNLYHALSIEDKIENTKDCNFSKKSGFGAHEVIIETPQHNKQMYHFNIDEFSSYFHIIKLRLSDLKKDVRLKYFSIFKNHGINAGATLEHSHTQLIALPFIPKKIEENLHYYKEYKEKYERDFFDDLIYDEIQFKKGLIFENTTFIAYCPYASKFAFEVLIVSKKNISSILECNDKDIYALSEITQFVFDKLHHALGDFDFNMLIQNGDLQHKHNLNRFYIQIQPRLYKIAGFELDSEIFINTFLPESAAKILRDE